MQKGKSYIKNGVLYCFYEIANYSEVIESALKEHGLEHGACEIICKPLKDPEQCKHGLTEETCSFCRGGVPTETRGGKIPDWLKT